MLLAEDLQLLVLDGETGWTMVGDVNIGLAGAVLIELADLGLVDVDSAYRGRVVLLPAPLPTHPLLVEALRRVKAKEGRRPSTVMRTLARGLRAQVADNLVNAGIVDRAEYRVLGLFPLRYLPVRDVAYVSALKEHVAAVLVEAEPDERTCTLICLLSSFNALTRVIDVPNLRAVKRRARQIFSGEWEASALSAAVFATISAHHSTD
jgi:hypothetical protein